MSATAAALPIPARRPGIDRWAQLGLRMADQITQGTLTVHLPDGTCHRVVRGPEPEATFVIENSQAFRRLMLGGSLGLAEAYIDGQWSSPDVGAVMRLAAVNEAEWLATLKGRAWGRILSWVAHRLRANTRAGAQRNIMSHYDLGNEFYTAWLDPGMAYSSALYATGSETLEQAQAAKIHALCRAIDLRPGMSLLEIGCGWGGFAEIAARDYGAHVTAITLSPSQLDYTMARIAAAGLEDRVEPRLQDYRDVPGRFDRIASIEMFEAVGERYWPAYFATLRDRLLPGGRAGVQTITIAERLWADYRGGPDFIQRHVFPGGMLPTIRHIRDHARAAGLTELSALWFGQDYATTLATWQQRFQQAWPRIARLPGFDARFKRLWDYYLAYCETGFRAGWTDVGQIVFGRQG